MAGAPPAGGCVPPCPPAPEDGLRVGPQPAAAPAVSTASANTATARADMGASFPRTSSCPVPTALASRPAEPPSQRSQIHHGPTPGEPPMTTTIRLSTASIFMINMTFHWLRTVSRPVCTDLSVRKRGYVRACPVHMVDGRVPSGTDGGLWCDGGGRRDGGHGVKQPAGAVAGARAPFCITTDLSA